MTEQNNNKNKAVVCVPVNNNIVCYMYEDPIARKIKEDIDWEKKKQDRWKRREEQRKKQKLKAKEDRKIRLRRKCLIDKYKVKKGCCMCGFNASHTALSFVVDKGIQKRKLTVSKKLKHIKEYFNYLKQGKVTCRNCIAISTSIEIKPTSFSF